MSSTRADRFFDDWAFSGGKMEWQAHDFERQQQVSKNDGGINVQNFRGCDGHFGGEARLLADLDQRMILADRAVFGHVAPRLAHEPDRRAVYGQGFAGAKEQELGADIQNYCSTWRLADGRRSQRIPRDIIHKPMPLTSGTKFGPYEIQSPLGAGGMGEVYRARDTRLGRDVALKILPESFAREADRLHRFEQEARAVAALNHPNILAIFDTGQSDGSPFLVSELLEGETLRACWTAERFLRAKRLTTRCRLRKGWRRRTKRASCIAILKPENIFITKDGRIKILDFGLAKLAQKASAATSDGATLTSHTAVGVVMGTASYMAPEQVRGGAGGPKNGHLRFRRCALRDVFRRASVPARHSRGDDDRGPERRPAGIDRSRAFRFASSRAHRTPLPGKRSGAAFSIRKRSVVCLECAFWNGFERRSAHCQRAAKTSAAALGSSRAGLLIVGTRPGLSLAALRQNRPCNSRSHFPGRSAI